MTQHEVKHDYVYRVFNALAPKEGPCDKRCGYFYKSSIPKEILAPRCAKCGIKMAFTVVRRELAEEYNVRSTDT